MHAAINLFLEKFRLFAIVDLCLLATDYIQAVLVATIDVTMIDETIEILKSINLLALLLSLRGTRSTEDFVVLDQLSYDRRGIKVIRALNNVTARPLFGSNVIFDGVTLINNLLASEYMVDLSVMQGQRVSRSGFFRRALNT